MKSVLVLDSCQRSALAVTRSLGKHGVRVYCADETDSALAGASRYCQRYFRLPSPLSHSDAFIEKLAEICRQHSIGMLLPMTELTTELLLRHRQQFPEQILPLASLDKIEQLADKCRLMELAATLQIPVPQGQTCKAGTIPDLQTLAYPLVLKPGKSWLQSSGKWLHTTVRFADNAQAAGEILQHDPAFKAGAYLLQQTVPGHGEGVFALYNRGKALTFFSHKRLREKPPRGGVSVLSESAEVDPVLKSYAKKLLDAAGWHGIAMVEFRVDDDGKIWLMEVNTRFWGSLQLAIDAGVDFPWLLYQLADGNEVNAPAQYKTGNRLRWLLGDLDSLYLTLKDAEFTRLEKLMAIIRFISPHPFITRHETNRLNDISPFFHELRQYFRDLG